MVQLRIVLEHGGSSECYMSFRAHNISIRTTIYYTDLLDVIHLAPLFSDKPLIVLSTDIDEYYRLPLRSALSKARISYVEVVPWNLHRFI